MSDPLIPSRSETVTPHSATAPYPGVHAALGPTEPEPGGGQLTRVVAALRRFAWLIALVTVAGTGGTILLTRTMKAEYEITATIYLQETNRGGSGPIQAPELFSSYNWVELVKTYAVLDPVVKAAKLYIQPASGVPAGFFDTFDLAESYFPGRYLLSVDDSGKRYSLGLNGQEFLSGSVADSVGRKAGFLWKPGPQLLKPGLTAAFSIVSPRDGASVLRDQLEVRLNDETSNFLRITLPGPDPQRLARTINALQQSFLQVATDLKKQKLRQLSNLLADQVAQQEAKLRSAETALESFRVATVTQPREQVAIAAGLAMTENPAYSRYFEQRVSVETIREEVKAIEGVLARLAAGETTVDAFVTIPAVRNAPDLSGVLKELSTAQADLRALRTKYTDDYRDVRVLIDRIKTITQVTVPNYAQALVRQLKIQQGDLQTRIDAAGQELRNIPVRTITEARLQREMESAKVLFTALQNRHEETKLAEMSAIPDVQIMEEAVAPSRPTGNQVPRIILMGFMASVGAGLALAILLDKLDKRFRYPEQASRELGLTIFGAIPAIPRARNGKPTPQEEMHQVIEAFRSVRLNLAHSFEADSPICLTISSPSPGDGKSLVAANLALSFAEAGYRTLLIDGDTRRGDLHRTFSADRRPGLLDYLGSVRLPVEGTLRPTSHPRLTLMPCGTRLQHGPELLGSARMAELISAMRGQYDVVLIDSPPLGAGIDPFVLATHSANILIVLRSGETDRQMAEVKLRILDRLPVRVLGAVLNHIHAGSGPYKYYSYSYGYAAEEEEIGDGSGGGGGSNSKEIKALQEGKVVS